MQVFVNKSGDGTERPSFDSGNPPLLCSTPRAGLPARTSSSAGSPNTRERESDDEVDIQEKSEMSVAEMLLIIHLWTAMKAGLHVQQMRWVSLNKMKSFKLQAYILELSE